MGDDKEAIQLMMLLIADTDSVRDGDRSMISDRLVPNQKSKTDKTLSISRAPHESVNWG